ncbi:MAG: MBL fold metallo-hydrolase [Burkholderiaceae bacterium]
MLRSRMTNAARAAALTAAFSSFAAAPAHAAAPMAKTQAPGYFRATLGDFEVTALSDGFLDLPVDKVLRQPPAKTDAALARYFQKAPVETSVNAFLVNTGAKLVLIDAGTGGLDGPTAGALAANLRAAGYRPEQVDDIFITHDHADHCGGLSHDGAAVFPNAVVHAGKGDADHYTSQAAGDGAAFASMAPYVAAHRFQPIAADGEIVPGVKAWATPGHTPGHTTYVVESRGERMIVTGDLIHVAAVQFDDPTVTVSFDGDGKAAEAERAKVFAQAAKDGTLIAAAHLQFPGMGRLKSDGKGYRYVPINYLHPR